jgi:RNA polymerase sigma factor (sigma-70 family)
VANAQLGLLVRHIHRLHRGEQAGGDGDAQLLARFVTGHDEEAFEALVRRHGPMVLGVCRRLLGDAHAAEDAFQATFLVLVRRAATLDRPELLGNWLHGVAARVAREARARTARRRTQERQAQTMARPRAEPQAEAAWVDLRPVLDEELGQLPEKYRLALVLCYLEGKTHEDAARALGIPVGSVSWRLSRGRELLRQRLTRRGVALTASVLAAVLSDGRLWAAVPAPLVATTVRSGLLLTAGKAASVIPARAAELAEAALRTMTGARLSLAAAFLLALGVGAAAIAGHHSLASAAEKPGADGPTPRVAAPDRPKVAPPMKDPDADGDGLPDFQEVHKYGTDPRKKDTSGGGTLDGDWKGRREHTYSVRAVLRIMPPFNLEAMNDDYQDVRVLKRTKDYADLEVVIYPLNTNAQAIKANPNWKKDYAGMKEYLAPGATTNWDEAMRKDLLRELAAAGIDPDKLTDKELVERVSRWLMSSSKYRYQFCTYYVHFPKGKPAILPGLEGAFEKDKGDRKWSVEEQFEHELLGREMFRHKTYGTCTSFGVYQATVLRALGIPTRTVIAIPVVDGSDQDQLDMLKKNLKHHRVRKVAYEGALSSGDAFTAHTFNEVYVGKRWRRLNYAALGQDILDRQYLGLMVHVHTFRDLSEAGLAETWGRRYALGLRDKNFPRSNPYRCLEIDDHFGKHARVANPPAPIEEHKHVTITRAYWLGSKGTPEALKGLPQWEMYANSGELMIHGEEWFPGRNHLQYKEFMRRADTAIVFRAKGHKDVKGSVQMSFITWESKDLREIAVLIPPEERAKMVKGVAYTIHPVNGKPGYTWKVKDGLTITRE